MLIQDVINNEMEINKSESSKIKSLEMFEKYYSETVEIYQADKTSTIGKVACREMEENFNKGIVIINVKELLSSVVLPSPDSEFEFLVVATWKYDLMTQMYPIISNQTSFTYWKDGMIQKVVFYNGTQVISC